MLLKKSLETLRLFYKDLKTHIFSSPIMAIKGRIIQFRRGRHTITEKHFLIQIPDIDKREKANSLAGKSVVWKSPSGKVIKGKIAAPHGNKGVVRAIFEKGLPGQAITTEVEIK
jgi:large subunit ribosomal protein L35Ae